MLAVLIAEDEGASTAARLAEVLQASPAAISGAVRYLSQVRLRRAARRAGGPARHLGAAQRRLVRSASTAARARSARWARALAREGVDGGGPGLAGGPQDG